MITQKTFRKYVIDAITSVKVEKKELTQIAFNAGIGRNILQKGFRYLYGTSIKEYLFQKRMEIARDMLKEGRLTRKQIAYKCGYRTPGNFSIAFKKNFGISPNEFRNQVA
jgi:AraC-like DNA-binding protein